jgi:hypothetical protein
VCAAFLSTFADASHMRASAEMDGVPVEADQLGEAQACLNREQQQGVIAASEPCRAIGSGKDRLDLRPRQEVHLTLVVALARYREDSLDKGTVGRLLEGGEPEERANGVRRKLRVLAPAPRFVSRSARNALIKGTSRSSRARSEGGLWSRACANVNSSRNVSCRMRSCWR